MNRREAKMSDIPKQGPARYKPAFAYIMFEIDSKREVVPISDIASFCPVDQFSFDRDKTVKVLHRYKDNTHNPEFFAARILRLGLTKASLQEEVTMRRIPGPKIFDEDKEDLSFVDIPSSRSKAKGTEQGVKEKSKKRLEVKKKKEDSKKNSVEINAASLAAAKLALKKRPYNYQEETSSDEETLVTKKYLKTLVKTTSDNEKKIEELKKRLRTLEKLVKRKDETDRLEANPKANVASTDVLGQENPAIQKMEIELGVLPIISIDSGNDHEVANSMKIVEAAVQMVEPDVAMIEELAGFVFPPEVLAVCSFAGKGSNRNKKAKVWNPLPETGTQFMVDQYERKLRDGGCRDISILAQIPQTIRFAVNEKCSSYRRPKATKPKETATTPN
ncbi:hypothetical protein B566_EDAN015446 [Ephemera danica]|nr:hypothetical protein B566_EDAN015446 [Ephemera danica]